MTVLDRPKPIAETQAGRQFAKRERAITELLYSLLADIEELREQFDADGRVNWGFVGSLGEVETLLTEVHNFLNNKE